MFIFSALTALVLVATIDGVSGCKKRDACRERGGVVVVDPCVPSRTVCSTSQYGGTECSKLDACGWHCVE